MFLLTGLTTTAILLWQRYRHVFSRATTGIIPIPDMRTSTTDIDTVSRAMTDTPRRGRFICGKRIIVIFRTVAVERHPRPYRGAPRFSCLVMTTNHKTPTESPLLMVGSQVYNCRTRRKDHVRFDLRTPGHDLGIRTPGHDHCTVLIIIVILHCPFCRIVRGRLFYDQRGSFTIICGLIVVRGF